jgi:hypothetical protein
MCSYMGLYHECALISFRNSLLAEQQNVGVLVSWHLIAVMIAAATSRLKRNRNRFDYTTPPIPADGRMVAPLAQAAQQAQQNYMEPCPEAQHGQAHHAAARNE